MTEQEWFSVGDPAPLLQTHYLGTARRQRLFACACCRRIGSLMQDEYSRLAVEAAEKHADGLLNKKELSRARSQAEKTSCDPAWISNERSPFNAAWNACRGNSGNSAIETAKIAAITVAWTTCIEGPNNVTWQERYVDERRHQTAFVRDIVGNPFRPVAIDTAWLTWHDGTIVMIAQGIYQERGFANLPILADALEEAGCSDVDILNHCRQPGEHVRGCWVVDLLLGK